MRTEQLGELLGFFLSLIPPRALRKGDGHTGRELDKEGETGTPREGAGPQGEQSPQYCWRPPALTQPHSGLPRPKLSQHAPRFVLSPNSPC